MTRSCPVCGAPVERSRVFLEENIDNAKLSDFSFSSRKMPEYMNHRLVQCLECDVVYVDDPPPASGLANAYHAAQYDSSEEADDAAAAYIAAVSPLVEQLPQRVSALDIGTGTGVFLERLKERFGFEKLVGIEPSAAAIAAAPAHRQSWIREGVFDAHDYEENSFDLVSCFMTMEHVPDPKLIASSVMRLLRRGGLFVTVTHDYRSPINLALGKRSPIIDIEHMQLFSKRSIERLFAETGYERIQARGFVNKYALSYWIRLFPLPTNAKTLAQSVARSTRAARIKVGINVGNTVAAGFKSG